MLRQTGSLAEAKQIVGEEGAKLRTALSAIAGSRWTLAILATLALAFGAHLAYAPERLPLFEECSLTQFGLPTDLDFGAVGEKAAEAAHELDLRSRAQASATANPERARWINAIGFALSVLLLAGNLTIATRRRRAPAA